MKWDKIGKERRQAKCFEEIRMTPGFQKASLAMGTVHSRPACMAEELGGLRALPLCEAALQCPKL